MWWDAKFNLVEDGDEIERRWWPEIGSDFAPYKSFWKKHIVPLTNRIDPDFRPEDAGWHYFRLDPEIDKAVEQMTMASYSTYYYMARSKLVIDSTDEFYAEDALLFLDRTLGNAHSFVKICRDEVARLLALGKHEFPTHAPLFELEFCREIRGYRNVIGHHTKLGKGANRGKEYLPHHRHLTSAKWSWRYVQGLKDSDFVEARPYLRQLLRSTQELISKKWQDVERALDAGRERNQYRKCWNLDENDCIPGKARSR